MTRRSTLFPLMAFTALTLTLAGCDDPANDQAAPADQAAVTAPADNNAMMKMDAAPADAMVAPQTAMIQAEGATAYATAEGAVNGAVFLTLHNTGSETDRLVSASSDKASMVEIHESGTGADGTMQMRKVDGVEVGAGQQVNLSPDGYHIMLMGLTGPLTQGETFNVTLNFEKGGAVSVPVTVTAPGGMASDAAPAMSPDDGAATEMPAAETPSADESGAAAAPASSTATPSYGSTMPAESNDSSPSATTDTPE